MASDHTTGCSCRNVRAKDEYATLEGATTLYESFKRSVHEFPTEDFIGERKMENGRPGAYEFLTFKQVEGKYPWWHVHKRNITSLKSDVQSLCSQVSESSFSTCPPWTEASR